MLNFIYHASPTQSFPSFPTRRSSDLAIVRSFPSSCGKRHPELDGSPCRPTSHHHQGRRRAGPDLHLSRSRHLRDRKSTRLNSSHRCISYAVFCLKKKNIIHSATTDYD